MSKHSLRSMILLLLFVLILTSCRTESSYLQYDKKSISKDVEYLNTHYMEIDVETTSVLYGSKLLDSSGTWYLKRDERKEYGLNVRTKDWRIRIKDKGYWIMPKGLSGEGTLRVSERSNRFFREHDTTLDTLFRFYAMMNVRDNTKRTYTKEDKEFNKLVEYYAKLLTVDYPHLKNYDPEIDYFKIREGKTKGSTYLAVGGKHREPDEDGYYTSWEDAVEIRFDVDAKKFTKRYDELVHTVETTPLSKPMKR